MAGRRVNTALPEESLLVTKAVGSVTADKFAGTSDQGSAKVLLHVNGNTLQIGDPDASKDAQGYPHAFYDKSMTRI